jgi:hypothetical protein
MGIHGFSPHYHVTTLQVKEIPGEFVRVGHKIPCCGLAIFEMCVSGLFSCFDGFGRLGKWPWRI